LETVWEIIKSVLAFMLRVVIINFFGVSTRWLFFKAIGRPRTWDYLAGKGIDDSFNYSGQLLFNYLVGFSSLSATCIGIAFLVFG
jgi:hypothetical protein